MSGARCDVLEALLGHAWGGDNDDNFIDEECLEDSCMEQIIQGVFRDPLIDSHDSPEHTSYSDDQFDREFSRDNMSSKQIKKRTFTSDFVPGLGGALRSPRLSSLTVTQHMQGIRVLAEMDSTTNTYACGRPVPSDRKDFEDIQEAYKKEQQEFMEWSRKQWWSYHCRRALRARPIVERVYAAERALRVAAAASLPTTYEFAAQLPLASTTTDYVMNRKEDLTTVDLKELPVVFLPVLSQSRSVVEGVTTQHLPQVCIKHPCHITLPNSRKRCELSMKDVHSELCEYAGRTESECVASEAALKCLVQTDKQWMLPITVKQFMGSNGQVRRVVVLEGEVCGAGAGGKPPVRARTARALHLLLRRALLRTSTIAESEWNEGTSEMKVASESDIISKLEDWPRDTIDEAGSDEEDNLCMDLGGTEGENFKENKIQESKNRQDPKTNKEETNTHTSHMDNCSCKGSLEKPLLPRSYTKWEVVDNCTGDRVNMIVHCTHKHAKDSNTEVILNTIPEFQLELGGSAQSDSRLKSCCLQLALRKSAVLLTSRINATSGGIVSYEWSTLAQLESRQGKQPGELLRYSANALFTVMDKLRQLMPGQYVLHHEVEHGENALLFVSRPHPAPDIQKVHLATLDEDSAERDPAEEARLLQEPPVLCDVLLPAHKLRKILPLAFSPYKNHYRPDRKAEDKKKRVEVKLMIKKKKKNKKRKNNKKKKELDRPVQNETEQWDHT